MKYPVCAISTKLEAHTGRDNRRTLDIGIFAGPIYACILLVDCVFLLFLEWWLPECDLDKVEMHWDRSRFAEVSGRMTGAFRDMFGVSYVS